MVIPLVVELDRLGSPRPGPVAHPATVLFVGRLSSHRRQDEVIRCFALYRRGYAPDGRLSWPVIRSLRAIPTPCGGWLTASGAVQIESGLSSAALGDRYRAADVFLCLSEQEGFCTPLLEAFHFGLPVIARPEGAVRETVGDAGMLVDDLDRAVVAELLHLALTDHELRDQLRRRAARRLEDFAPANVTARLRQAVEATAARARAGSEPDRPDMPALS